ncbi:MAG: bifunctional diaminohydroxyphosphoribosylaminopyrimidine deaminase/5-amino-6-(5-phosphoribosylamino)uracil reductase RibD [Flavobacteriales bacterium]
MKHEDYMQRCLDLAQLGSSWVAPNPMVGCVIVKDGKIIGEGYHQHYGQAHAEVNAIASVKDKSFIEGATVYVNLEPCSHHGKTPPCSDLLVQSKVAKVIIGCRDSNKLVSGKGIEKLKRAGIEVEEGMLEDQCRLLNKRFFNFHEKGRPYVILKWAQTKDGYLDRIRSNDEKGINWISCEETKSLVHKWRSQEQGILVGKHTAMNDNPSLTVREFSGRNPIRILIDSQLQVQENINLYSADAPTIIFNRIKDEKKDNIEWVKIKETSTKTILEELYKRNISSIMVEGGSRTLQYFIIDNVWDEAYVIVGDVYFQEGVKAPLLNRVPSHSHPFGTDTIYYFKRR